LLPSFRVTVAIYFESAGREQGYWICSPLQAASAAVRHDANHGSALHFSNFWRRGSLTVFIQRHEFAWDLVIRVLTVPYVILAFREDSATGPASYTIVGLATIFLLEFGARCYDSSDRGKYFRTHWLDLITAIPIPDIPASERSDSCGSSDF